MMLSIGVLRNGLLIQKEPQRAAACDRNGQLQHYPSQAVTVMLAI